MRTFEYRIYPNKAQAKALMGCLIQSRHLYNEMLAASKEHYEQTGKVLMKYDLTAHFRGRGGEHVPASTVQMLADRLHKAFKRFFAMRELGEQGGFPRWKSPNRWHSIQLRQHKADFSLAPDGKHLSLPKKLGGSIKIKLHRPLEGTPKTAHLVRRADGHWYALIVCETEPHNEQAGTQCEHPTIGIDVGLRSFLTDSEGHTVANPRYYRTSQKTLRRKQRQMCRRKKDSKRYRKAARNAAKTHLKIKRQRRDHHFKVAKPYAEGYQRIAVEDLQITNMVQNHHLAKSIMDAGWGQFLAILTVKAENAGHGVIRVSPRYTTQVCSHCGELMQKSLSVRTHICTSCGFVADRDVNAAKNILLKAGALPSGTVSDGSPGELRSPR
jgi:putative transposase